MIALDTNVVSELMRVDTDAAVIAWLDGQPAESVWTTSVCVFEVRHGIVALAPGRRRQALERAFDEVLDRVLSGRVLDFDRTAAFEAARIAIDMKVRGHGIDVRDLQIAATASARRATLVTRNTRHFVETGIALVDPWTATP